MSLILYDFECPAGHGFEALAYQGEALDCPKCGKGARQVIRKAPRLSMRMGLDPVGCPTMGDKWADMHERETARQNEHDGPT